MFGGLQMRVKFWGVRGSTPTPQKENMGYGGNTSCVEIRSEHDEILILDGGTGLRLLGKSLEEEFTGRPIRAHIFFSHFHLDHIQGIPFFKPLYNADNHFTFYFAGRRDDNLVMNAIAGVMANPYFPVDVSKLPCSREYVDLTVGTFNVAGMNILVLPLNHPQGCFGYRIVENGKVFAYCTDIEHGVGWSDTNIRRLAKDADLLVADSQYTEEELLEHIGWGHSSWKQAIEVGNDAGARQIALYHFDPSYEDTTIEAMVDNAKRYHPNVIAAKEGLELTI